MPKLYKLLRNNRESGPFTIGELLQQPLQPADILWIEGQSTAWTAVTDLELMPGQPEMTPQLESGSPSILPDDLELKAAALRERAMAYQPAANPRPVFPDAARLSLQAEEEGIDFVDHRKEKSRALSDVFMTLLAIALFAGGLYASRSMFQRSDEVAINSPAVVRIVSTESNAAKPMIAAPQPAPVAADTADQTVALPVKRKPAAEATATAASRAPAEDLKGEPVTEIKVEEKKPKAEAAAVVPPAEDVKSKTESDQPKEAAAENEGRKKGLGQAIKNIFRKKKKEDKEKKDED